MLLPLTRGKSFAMCNDRWIILLYPYFYKPKHKQHEMKGPITRFLHSCAPLMYKKRTDCFGLNPKNRRQSPDWWVDSIPSGFLRSSYSKCNFREDLTPSWPAWIAYICYVRLILVVCLLKEQRTIAYSPQALSLPI